jgi:hypothetical protein
MRLQESEHHMSTEITVPIEPDTATFIVEVDGGEDEEHAGVRYVQLQDGALWLMGQNRSIIRLYAPGVWRSVEPAK